LEDYWPNFIKDWDTLGKRCIDIPFWLLTLQLKAAHIGVLTEKTGYYLKWFTMTRVCLGWLWRHKLREWSHHVLNFSLPISNFNWLYRH
jgi:hypothetical protein